MTTCITTKSLQIQFLTITYLQDAFSASTLLVGHQQSIRPVKTWVMRCCHGYLTAAKSRWFAYGPSDATATPLFLASLKSRTVYLPGAGLHRLSWKKAIKWVSLYLRVPSNIVRNFLKKSTMERDSARAAFTCPKIDSYDGGGAAQHT